jgi:hypothetical protein
MTDWLRSESLINKQKNLINCPSVPEYNMYLSDYIKNKYETINCYTGTSIGIQCRMNGVTVDIKFITQ